MERRQLPIVFAAAASDCFLIAYKSPSEHSFPVLSYSRLPYWFCIEGAVLFLGLVVGIADFWNRSVEAIRLLFLLEASKEGTKNTNNFLVRQLELFEEKKEKRMVPAMRLDF